MMVTLRCVQFKLESEQRWHIKHCARAKEDEVLAWYPAPGLPMVESCDLSPQVH